MRIVALLSNAYGGSGIMECCAINPVGGAELNLSANRPDFTTQDIQNIYDYGMVDFDVCGKALEPLIESYVATSSRRETQRVVGEAVEYARDNCGAKLGEAMTEKQQVRFVDLVLKRLTPFLLHQLARPDFRGGTGRTFQSD